MRAVHEEEGDSGHHCPDAQTQRAGDLDTLVSGDVKEVSCHEANDVTLVPPAPGGEVPGWQVVIRGNVVFVIVLIVFVPVIEILVYQ